MIKYIIIPFIFGSLTLVLSGCGGKGSKERCEEKEGHWEWKEIEEKCEEKVPAKTSEECEAKGGIWNPSTYQCQRREGEVNLPDPAKAEALKLGQKECETPEKKREGFGWIQGRCEEKSQYIIYSYMQDTALQISSRGDSVLLQHTDSWTKGPDCVRIKKSQGDFLKITTASLLISICDNTDDDEGNNCKIFPSIYDEKEGTHKYRVQTWTEFDSKRSSIKLLSGGHTDKNVDECKTLDSES